MCRLWHIQGCLQMIELVRTWTTRPPGVLDDRTRVKEGAVWRCTVCGIFFQSLAQANKHIEEKDETKPA